MALEASISGKEQLILLPIQPTTFTLTPSQGPGTLDTGMHAIVTAGRAGIDSGAGFVLDDVNDAEVVGQDVSIVVGPLWRDLVQFSASVTPGGIKSDAPDEVNHSRWQITDCRAERIDIQGGEKIRLRVGLHTQGEGNGWISLAYQVYATGTLARWPKLSELSADF